MADNKKWIQDNTARIEALAKRLEEASYTDVSDTTATSGDVATGKVFYDKDGKKTEGVGTIVDEFSLNVDYAKQMDTFDNIISGRPIVERDYTAKEIAKLDRILANITQGEVVNG